MPLDHSLLAQGHILPQTLCFVMLNTISSSVLIEFSGHTFYKTSLVDASKRNIITSISHTNGHYIGTVLPTFTAPRNNSVRLISGSGKDVFVCVCVWLCVLECLLLR